VGENDTKKQGTYHCATHFLVSTQTPWSVFVSRNYEKTNSIQHNIFASCSKMEEIDDESVAFEAVSNCEKLRPTHETSSNWVRSENKLLGDTMTQQCTQRKVKYQLLQEKVICDDLTILQT
jgi:hypothetical protein